MRNGKGKEYSEGEVIFEGEYKNGWRNGKGKEFNDIGEVIFEGEYLNGEKNGNGKEYEGGEVIFEGEYENGLKIWETFQFYYNDVLNMNNRLTFNKNFFYNY